MVLAEIVRKIRECQISLAELMGENATARKLRLTLCQSIAIYKAVSRGAVEDGRRIGCVDKHQDDFLVRA